MKTVLAADEGLAYAPILSRVVSAAADLALVIGSDGNVLEIVTGAAIQSHPGWNALVGKSWRESVRGESQGKVDQLLEEARAGRTTRPREVNQIVEGVGDVPFRFSAVRMDDDDRVIALGHDLRPLSALQQRMVAAQQTMDRDYGRLRQVDTRYRLLFHVSSEGVVVAEGPGHRIVEANPAAASLLGEPVAGLQGKTLLELFEPQSRADVQALLIAIEAGARPTDIQARLQGHNDLAVAVSAFLFRQLGSTLILLRFWPSHATAGVSGSRASRMLSVLDAMPDGFVVTGENGRILSANAAFFEMVQRAGENQVVGEPLDRWVGRPGVDLNIMLATLREHRTIKNFSTIVRADFGPPEEALVTAVAALDGKVPCLGFTIRSVSARALSSPPAGTMTRSAEQLRELVGRVPLKDLVQEAADMIERLCIVAALDVSGNNRASAAQLLGLSRQGLYSKMRRHALAEFGPG
jgi:transcriptional regulator PpsR